MQGMYSMRSPAVKRLMKEAYELREPTEQYECHPLEDNLFEWHFTIRGPAGTEFDGGLYHGRIVLPPEYPMKPPSIILLTSNGRFETNKKICLSISGHHPESWQPSWSIRTALLAIIGFMPTHGAGALGSLDYTPDERKILAKRSQDFKCPTCGNITNILKDVTEDSEETKREAQEVAAQMSFQDEQERNAALKTAAVTSAPSTAASNSVPVTTSSPSPETSASSPPSVPQSQYQPAPNQFPQFPFRMPFMPQFPASPTNTTNPLSQTNIQNPSNVLSQVPRFPLPFVSPFMGQFPPFMPPGGLPMPPGAQGMFPPAWTPTQWQGPVSTSPGHTTATATPSTGATSLQSTVTTAAATSVTSATAANASSSRVSTSETQQTTTSASADSGTTTSQPAAGTSQTATESSTATTPPTTRTVTRRVIVRRRVGANTNVASTTVIQSAVLGRTHRQTESSTGFTVFVTVIMSIIIMLLLKRFYQWNFFPFLN